MSTLILIVAFGTLAFWIGQFSGYGIGYRAGYELGARDERGE